MLVVTSPFLCNLISPSCAVCNCPPCFAIDVLIAYILRKYASAVAKERPTVSFDMSGSDNTARLVVEAIDRQQRSRLASLPLGGAGRP